MKKLTITITITITHMEKLAITITITFTRMAKRQLQSQLRLGSLTDKKRIPENDILGKIWDTWDDILRYNANECFS